jgi:TPR repeat protein
LDGPSLERAAARGDVNAEAELGFRYLTGCKGFNYDYDEAAQLFRRAADAGNSKAQFYLASMFKEGRGAQA